MSLTRVPSTNGRPIDVGGTTLVISAIVDEGETGGERSRLGGVTASASRLKAVATVRRDAAAIYGGLLVTVLVTVLWQADVAPEFIAFSVLISVLVFWLTHVWAEVVEQRLKGPTSRSEVIDIASREASMVVAAVPPILVLGIGRLGLLTVDQAIGLALVVCLAQLFLWGLAIGTQLGRGWPVAVGVAAVELALGAFLVGLKVVVVH
jgi:hypothetical protein